MRKSFLQTGLLLLLELALCELVFAGIAWLTLSTQVLFFDALLSASIVAVAFWWGFQWGTPQLGDTALKPVILGIGMTFLAESLITYVQLGEPLSLGGLGGGCLVCIFLILGLRKWLDQHSQAETVLLVGCNAAGDVMIPEFGSQLVGVVEARPSHVPPGTAYLGEFNVLQDVIVARKPITLVLDTPDWEQQCSPRFLLNCKLQGMRIEAAAAAYERIFQRISVDHYQPFHYWQEALRTNRRVMAFQAVYSNLVGLLLVVGLSPVLILLGLASRAVAGPGLIFESDICMGFQKAPFSRRSFRIRNVPTGQMTVIGKLISRLRLTNLPQVLNLVRGEMALFGPSAVRFEFAQYLEELSPLYAHRFSMKPGVFGWAQAHADSSSKVPATSRWETLASVVQEENVRIGYDLYYLEYGTLFLDLEIFARRIVKGTTGWMR